MCSQANHYFEFRNIIDEDELSVRLVFQIASGGDPSQKNLNLLHRPRWDQTEFDHKFRLTGICEGHFRNDGFELVIVDFAAVNPANDDKTAVIFEYLTSSPIQVYITIYNQTGNRASLPAFL